VLESNRPSTSEPRDPQDRKIPVFNRSSLDQETKPFLNFPKYEKDEE
jgi:hypothetical protein